ncbi:MULTISPECIES: RHS repeat-associated core domain-containing protein [unclassified Pseudomonas]|uniref:RHS repeat-associated core domain-containing protein n=1 Tax=unclassified Pseudomonas TaxID=196821 RepID=UPI001CBBE1D9|nr:MULTISPECIES: RHS repeat-associated core domain-containing protein [unclassified Pseudomonas]
MHSHTPSISVIEPRGLAVRALAYYRRAVGEPVETRVTHQLYDAVGRLTEQRDPRLFALAQSGAAVPPNLLTLPSLSGQVLCSDSVDAGWQLSLPGAAGQSLEAWDQRGWHRRTEHDLLLRPLAVFEHYADEAERCAERISWGRVSPDDALHNRCGQSVRHDDPAGSRLLPEYGLTGTVLTEVRHFLAQLDSPDWPVTEAERNQLLEPGDGLQSAWRFAATGEALSQTDAKGHVRHFAHDRAGQLREVSLQQAGHSAAEPLVHALEYNAFGQVQQELAGNGMRTFSTYDPADGRLLSLANQDPHGVFLQHLSYRYDPVGNITEITDAALPIQYFANQRIEPVRRFTYDTQYQLIKATGWETAKPSFGPALPEWQAFGPPDASRWRNYSETYHYDAAGNLLERLHLGAENDTLTMQVAAHSNRSIKERPGADLEALFDARGNLLELQPGQAMQWNGRNELAQVTQVVRLAAADDRERFVYDAEGTRLRKWRSAAAKSVSHTSEVRYLPGLELHSHSASGEQLQVISVQAGRCSVRLLHWDSTPPGGVANDQLRYCFDDHLGSSAIEVDAQAKPISQEVYYPFGGTAWLAGRHEVETSYKTIRYSGKERDATGLYYYGARYYAPWLQHWLNPDPAGAVDGVNFYRFVRNSPINYMDERGNKPVVVSAEELELEKRSESTRRIVYRGKSAFEEDLPAEARAFEVALDLAIRDFGRTVAALNYGTYNKGLVEAYFGSATEDTIDALRMSYQRLLEAALKFKSEPERLVVFIPIAESAPTASVYLNDPKKKIYMNQNIAHENSSYFSYVLMHELSHLFSGRGGVSDKWYMGSLVFDQFRTVRVGVRSAQLMAGRINKSDVFPALQRNFIQETGAWGMWDGVYRFNYSQALRTRLALSNPDSIACFAAATGERVEKKISQPSRSSQRETLSASGS